MKKYVFGGIVLAAVLLVGAGCGKPAPTPAPAVNTNQSAPTPKPPVVTGSVTGHSWEWIRTEVKGGDTVTPRRVGKFVVTFGGDGKLTGKTDCNSFFGEYEAKDGTLILGPIGATKMFCEGAQENDFMTQFGAAESYSFGTDGGLILGLKAGAGSMYFAIKKPVTVAPITHAAMVLTWGDVTIYNDPTDAKGFAGENAANIVLVSDIHGDHYNLPALEALVGPDTALIVPKAVRDLLSAKVAKQAIVLSNGGKIEQDGINITAIPMYNLPESKDSKHTKGRGNGYLLEKDGFTVYIAGDTSGIPEMRALRNIDIAFVPMNGPTMTVEEAADAVLAFAPKQVYPYHYRSQDGLSDVAKFKKLVNDGDKSIEVVQLNWYPTP